MKIALLFFVLSLLHVSTIAGKQSYIVYMGAHSHPEDATIEDFDRVTGSHHEFLATFLGSLEEARDAIIYSYTRHINGFSAILEEHQAAEISKHQDVVSVFLDKAMELHTTRSWSFMSLENNGLPSLSWKEARFGEDTIIGNLDTGVWPESESFSDIGYGPVPSRWKGSCENSSNPDGVYCNRKLIGAKHFNKGYKAGGGNVSKSMESARDYDGHGSHTLSTAGGNFVHGASINGIPFGTAKGGSPRARVASYKVCWPQCLGSDSLAAFDMAIHDGVDVLSVSIGGDVREYFEDSIAIGAFHANQKGIVVVCSAGNAIIPFPGSVTNAAPWIITVAASTMDREFQSFVELGNGLRFKGSSLSQALPTDTQYPLISAADAKLANASVSDAMVCMEGTLDEKKVKGKILACLTGNTDEVDKSFQAKSAGAAGMILCNSESDSDDVVAYLYFLPTTRINFQDGSTVFKYINSTKEPTAYLTAAKPSLDVKPAPSMALFSARGPNVITPEIMKPDITAPGVDVIAAYSQAANPTGKPYDHRKVPFMPDTGTSMACPHISGIAGLLKTLHPTWSPAAIKSAIMTTARTRANTIHPMVDGFFDKATPFHYGAGHVRPSRALNPGLIYDITTTDYLHLLCAFGYNKTKIETLYSGHHKCSNSTSSRDTILNFNYPSITVPDISNSTTVTRTVTNVGSPGVYTARVRQPFGVSITVKPKQLKFEKIGEKKKFELTMVSKGPTFVVHKYGELLWSDGKHFVKSPIAVATSG